LDRPSSGVSPRVDATKIGDPPEPTTSDASRVARRRARVAQPFAAWPRVRRQVAGLAGLGGIGLVAGLALSAAFPPLGWWPIAVPAAAAVMLAARRRGWRGGLLVGFMAGLGEFLPLIFWLHVVTPLAWLVLTVAESCYLAVLGAGLALVIERVKAWPLWAACLWVAEELVRSRWPLGGFGWGRLAFSQADTPFTGYAALAGAPLVTFAVALSAALLAMAVSATFRRRGSRRTARSGLLSRLHHLRPAAALPLVAALGVPLLGTLVPRPGNGDTVQVAVVQGNVPHPGTHFLGRAEQVLDNHLAETAKLIAGVANGTFAAPHIVLWPENASDVDPLTDASVRAKIQAAAQALGAPILVGAVLDAGPDHVTNTGVVWDPETGPGERYTKRHLVPFGEYIPWRGLVSHLTTLTSLVPKNFLAGDGEGALDIGPTRIADVMCFEVAFDGAVRSGVTHGGRLIVVQTNNATYMGTAETTQQLAMSQLRAVEHGRSVVVAATSGISAIVAPDGHVVTRTRELTPAIIDQPVVERSQITVADHLGAVPEWVIGILGGLAVAAGIARTTVPSARRRPDSVPVKEIVT
jgi:apolipoprotein N-acyltransferase